MNREIKFRAWSKTQSKMVEVTDLHISTSLVEGVAPDGTHSDYIRMVGNVPYISLGYGDNANPLMQFTGLKDRNGKDVYEGDILLDDTEGEAYDVVEWNPTNGGFDTRFWYSPKELVENVDAHEITGSVYENPELLK